MIAKSEHPEHGAQSQENRHECDQATASSTIHRSLLQGGGRVVGRPLCQSNLRAEAYEASGEAPTAKSVDRNDLRKVNTSLTVRE